MCAVLCTCYTHTIVNTKKVKEAKDEERKRERAKNPIPNRRVELLTNKPFTTAINHIIKKKSFIYSNVMGQQSASKKKEYASRNNNSAAKRSIRNKKYKQRAKKNHRFHSCCFSFRFSLLVGLDCKQAEEKKTKNMSRNKSCR